MLASLDSNWVNSVDFATAIATFVFIAVALGLSLARLGYSLKHKDPDAGVYAVMGGVVGYWLAFYTARLFADAGNVGALSWRLASRVGVWLTCSLFAAVVLLRTPEWRYHIKRFVRKCCRRPLNEEKSL